MGKYFNNYYGGKGPGGKWQMEYARITKGQRNIITLMGEPGVQSEFEFGLG